MSDMQVQPESTPAVPQTAPLTQWQRVVYIFSAPSKTFLDIRDHSRSWWMPLIVAAIGAYLMFAAITTKIGWQQVAENVMHQSPKAEERMANATPEQRATSQKFTVMFMEGAFAANPLFVLAFTAVGSLVLWGTVNLVFGGKATFGSVFSMWMYASLPGIIKALLCVAVIFSGIAPESFNLNNPAPTNIGAFLNPAETNAGLYALCTAIDIVTIWTLVLGGIGVAIMARIKRTSGYIAVFGWWAVMTLIGVGWAAAFG